MFCQQISKVLNTSCTPVIHTQSMTLPCQPVFIPLVCGPWNSCMLPPTHMWTCKSFTPARPCFKYHGTCILIPLTNVHSYKNTLCMQILLFTFQYRGNGASPIKELPEGNKAMRFSTEAGVFGSTYTNELIIKSCV